ncbi:YlxM family DNA-binding protein [Companilactobacillus metriopterae]|uniref:YlxM family DNA-binding protein n=1 Tax=Companilactobacillus metriopterae TaxID=1909267 RepID=UPI00100B3738|nr:sigma factor-like helix-turn-helix DNA-binding protein [Companilactobacillus metriopterae]
MKIDETNKINLLYDFYHSLLTEKQDQYMYLYYVEDFSLSEISEQLNVSRQAVLDNLHRTVNSLEKIDSELNLINRTQEIDYVSQRLSQIVEDKYPDDNELHELVDRISKINEK